MNCDTYADTAMKVRILNSDGKYYYISIETVTGNFVYIYGGTRIECIAMAQYHNFEVTYIAP